jgi:hypothetical protein
MMKPKKAALARRGCLVRVTSGSADERWFAVGIAFHGKAEAAVCQLDDIQASDIVVARRQLIRAEIETLALKRGEVTPFLPAAGTRSSPPALARDD